MEVGAIVAVEPERIVHAIEAPTFAPPHVGNGAAAPAPLPSPACRRAGARPLGRLPAGIPRRRDAPDCSTRSAGEPRPACACGGGRRRDAGDLGAAGRQGRQLVSGRPRHSPGRAGHGDGSQPPRLRRAHDQEPVVRVRPGGAGPPRTRHPLHRHLDGSQVPRRDSALRGGAQGRDPCGQGPEQRRVGHRLADPRRDQLGRRQPVRRDLDVSPGRARRSASPSPRCSKRSR